MQHVYLMPGMAASPTIFEHWDFPGDRFKLHRLAWEIPQDGDDLNSYARRMTRHIKHKLPVLVGVSFGGVLVQEMSQIIPVAKTIIISSVKCRREMPRRMKLSRKLKLYKILPTRLVSNIDYLAKYAFGETVKHRIELYQKYLDMNDVRYLDWAIKELVCWNRKEPDGNVLHIHGDADNVFPYRYIGECITIPGGTHIMVLTKYKWFNENLPRLLSQN